ncbi:YchJ family protein [Collimonas sp.]|uniref:YchJ family protein n=1 Tax=Collimonas sp. TaxID=1963772 RepID=UPI002D03A384|nr:YchJ family metal-binding protein [Collimonas sp.]HWX00427.1 YchJ family metal-binding protein [Collimonas sp.]
MTAATIACPCGGGNYAQCCGRYHTGAEIAPTALALMRSRYSAYVMDNGAYLQATWQASTRPQEPIAVEAGLKWLGLDVRRHEADGDSAIVEFVARYKIDGRAHRLHEVSRFVREADVAGVFRWFYVDGSFPEKK